MLINVDSCFGNLLAASAYKNSACRYFVAAICASALFGMMQSAAAEQQAVIPGTTQAAGAYTGRVRAEGSAPIGAGGRSAARHEAINDALRTAGGLAGAHAMADKSADFAGATQLNQGLQPVQSGNRYSILREWEAQGRYHVTVSAEVVKNKFDAENAALVPIPKKKVVITQFDVASTIHVNDISNIYDGFPAVLSSRLEASGRFLSAYTGRSIPIETDAAQREAIIQIAGETGAQLLISGMVVNAAIGHERWSVDTPFDGSLKVPFGGYKKRHIEIELSVYDGITGARMLSRRLGEQAEGDVMVGNDKPFGSSIFFETEFGKATNRLVDSAVKEIQEAVENVPFSAHIIKIEGKKVFLDAGDNSLLKPGDRLVAYTSDPADATNGAVPGIMHRAAELVALIEVKPQFSIGELPEDAAKLGIRAGNIAKISLADQQDLVAKQIVARQLAEAQQEAKAEAARVKAEQDAKLEAERIKAEQAAQAETARIKEEKKAKAQVIAEAKAAKLKAQQEAKAARGTAAQQARARALAVRLKAAQKAKAQAAAGTKAAKAATPKNGQAAGAEMPQNKAEAQETEIQTEAQTATKGKLQKNIKAGTEKENSKRKVLPPGEEALRTKAKSAKP